MTAPDPMWIECSWCGRYWPADDRAEFLEATKFCVACPCPEARDVHADHECEREVPV